MATVRDIVEAALRKISVTPKGQSANAEDIKDGVYLYNAMMHGFVQSGYITSHSDQIAGDTSALPDAAKNGIAAHLSLLLSSEYNIAPPPRVAYEAEEGLGVLYAAIDDGKGVGFDKAIAYNRIGAVVTSA